MYNFVKLESGSERLSNLLKATQFVKGRGRNQITFNLAPKHNPSQLYRNVSYMKNQ